MKIYLEWSAFKDIISNVGNLRWVDRDEFYLLSYKDAVDEFTSSILKTNEIDVDDFETNYKNRANKLITLNEVVTQFEKSDKTLRTWQSWTVTDSNGIARFAVQVPDGGRWVAYGDCEFEERQFLDCVSKLEVADLDRLIAWQMALSIDPEATEPVADAVVQANGYPLYPVVGHYDERDFPEEPSENSAGTTFGGMAMTFQYGITEAQPVAGYAFIPGGYYLVIEAKKETAVADKRCKISVDWAESNAE